MKLELHIEIARPIEEVFDFLADLRNEKLWNPRVIRVEKITEGAISAGTKFHGVYTGIGELPTELLQFERPRAFSFRGSSPRMKITGGYKLKSHSGGTKIDLEAELLPQSFLRLFTPLMALMMQSQNAATRERLKQALIAKAPASAG